MLDVHPPEHRIFSFRDFLIHLLTITVGLLIALGLENLAEWAHHRHIRHQAEANIRQELSDNRNDFFNARDAIKDEARNLNLVIEMMQLRIENKAITTKQAQFGYRMANMSDASWKTATATGAISLMDYSEAQRFAAAYQEQSEYLGLQHETLSDFLSLMSVFSNMKDPNQLSSDDAKEAIRDSRRILAHLGAMQDVGRGLEATYNDALKPE